MEKERYIVLFIGHSQDKNTLQINVMHAENKEQAAFNTALSVSSDLLINNARFVGVYTPEEIKSLKLEDIIDSDIDYLVIIESELPFDENKSIELLMNDGTLIELAAWSLDYEKHLTRAVIGEKLPSMTTNSSSSLEMGKPVSFIN